MQYLCMHKMFHYRVFGYRHIFEWNWGSREYFPSSWWCWKLVMVLEAWLLLAQPACSSLTLMRNRCETAVIVFPDVTVASDCHQIIMLISILWNWFWEAHLVRNLRTHQPFLLQKRFSFLGGYSLNRCLRAKYGACPFNPSVTWTWLLQTIGIY